MPTLRLHLTTAGYQLVLDGSRQRPLRVDFSSAKLRHRLHSGGKELLLKAAAVKPGMFVVDCTAGLGTDGFLLASRGCHVTGVEHSQTLWLMLEEALARARLDEGVRAIVERMNLVRGDAVQFLRQLDVVPDVIIIDVMFPQRRKSAEVRGELQVMQQLLGKDEPVQALLAAARQTGCRRIVVKRPLHGGEIPGLAPTHRITGKASRFDVFQQL